MKRKGNTRQIDALGRIVIPKDFRNTLGINDFDSLELFLEDDRIVIKKLGKECVFCYGQENLAEFSGKYVCASCMAQLVSPSEKAEAKHE